MHKMILAASLLALSVVSVSANSAANKVKVCHKGKEIMVDKGAVPAHERHGDTRGKCDTPEPEGMSAVVMMRCEAIEGNGVVVVSASSSVALDIPMIQIFPPVEDPDCAQASAALLNAGLQLRSITSGSAQSAEEDDESLHLYTDYLFIGLVPEGG